MGGRGGGQKVCHAVGQAQVMATRRVAVGDMSRMRAGARGKRGHHMGAGAGGDHVEGGRVGACHLVKAGESLGDMRALGGVFGG